MPESPHNWTNTARYTRSTVIVQRPPLLVRIMLLIAIAIGFVLALVILLPLAALLLILAAIGHVVGRFQGRGGVVRPADERENVRVIDRGGNG